MKRKAISRKPLPHVLCARCGAKVVRDAYYCKKCEAVVDATVAPGMKLEDTRLLSRLIAANRQHLFRNASGLLCLIIFIITGVQMGHHYLSVASDNHSSSIFQMIVDAPTKPLECNGPVCHILINIKNKTQQNQSLSGTPSFISSTGAHFVASDPTLLGTGSIYCQPHIDLTLAPSASKKYIGICVQGAPHGSTIVLVQLTNSKNQLIVSGKLDSLVP